MKIKQENMYYISDMGYFADCPECNIPHAIQRDFNYCPYCGEPIEWVSAKNTNDKINTNYCVKVSKDTYIKVGE